MRREVKDARSRPAKVGSHRRHSGEGRNPVVYSIHSRKAGMTTSDRPRNPVPAKSGNYRLPRPWTVRSIQACRDNAGAVIPAHAGMDYLNHWIPAFAGMTKGDFRAAPSILALSPHPGHPRRPVPDAALPPVSL